MDSDVSSLQFTYMIHMSSAVAMGDEHLILRMFDSLASKVVFWGSILTWAEDFDTKSWFYSNKT